MKYTIEVTSSDIRNGTPKSAFNCPIALALTRAMSPYVIVGGERVLHVTSYGSSIDLPPQAQSFIADFDAGRTVDPFTFELDIPSDG